MIGSLNIIALGSGAPDGQAGELLKRGLDLAGKEHKPNVLVIPTAKVSQEAHDNILASTEVLYKNKLKLPYRVLHGFNQLPSRTETDEIIEWADVVYVAGGDTDRMMKIWKTNDIDAVLKTRALGGLVMTGTSAGAIASFTWGHSDSLSYRVSEGEPWDYIAVEGLGLLRGAVTPHYNTAPTGIPRSELFKKMFRQEKDRYGTTYGFGLDNLAGIEVSGGILRPISAVEDAGVTILDGRTDEISQHRLAKDETLALQTLVA